MNELILKKIASICRRDPSSISYNTSLQEVNWDSLANLEFMSYLDELGADTQNFNPSDFKTIGDLVSEALRAN